MDREVLSQGEHMQSVKWNTCSQPQPVVALSSCEAEYMAITEAGKEAIWCTRFLKALGHETEGPADLRADNKSAIALSDNPEFHRRVKHIELRYHWIRENIASKDIELTYVSTDVMAADGLTKPLAVELIRNVDFCNKKFQQASRAPALSHCRM